MDKLTIQNLRCSCHIGCTEQERELAQVLFVTIEMELDTRPSAQADDLELTINYAHLSRDILALTEKTTCRLIETLAQNIAELCLGPKYDLIQAVTVKILKTAGIPEADGAILEIRRER